MSDQTGTVITDGIVAATDPVAAAIRAVQARVEDVGVRESRNRGWCEEFSSVMSAMFPDGPLDQNRCDECHDMGYGGMAWRDSDGACCRGHVWRDQDGYNRDGYNAQGWNRDGVNRDGVRRDDPTRYRFDRNGNDVNGYNVDGQNRHGRTRAEQERYCRYAADADGALRTITGYDWRGYHADGSHSYAQSEDHLI